MGLIKGALKSLGGAAKIVTSPLTTGLKMAGTSLKTGGKVLGELAEGDLGGALNAATTGAKEQVGNVTGHFTGNLDNLKQIGSGHREFLAGGVGLIGTPIKGAARLAGNGLTTAGNVTTNVATGNLSGAANSYVQGAGNQLGILGDTAREQLNNVL